MKVIHVAQICSSRSWGGMEMHVAVVSEQLQKRGHSVTVFCAPGSALDQDCRRRGVATIAFAPAGYFDPGALLHFRKQLQQQSFDLLHAHFGKDLWTCIPANQWSGARPLIFIKHIGTQKPKRDPVHRYLYSRVNMVLAISQVIARNLADTHPVDMAKIRILHHGVDLSLFTDLTEKRRRVRREWGVADDALLIGTIGRLQEGKGHLEFLAMAEAIGQEFPHTQFVIVGEPTRGEEQRSRAIYEKAAPLQSLGRLHMPGFRPDIPAVLAAMDIFAFPSRAEAFGLVLIEAMAAGKPVVSTRSDGVLDIVEHNVNGLLFELEQQDELTAAVRSLIQHPATRIRLAQEGLRTVQARFSMERMLHDLDAVYLECLNISEKNNSQK
jgi:glycosyltransferase involved in cell wall biosynthesis